MPSTSRLALLRSEETWLILLLLLGLPAFLINLAQLPLIGDEGIRTLVALEMDLQQQYIAPTLNGDYYFKKPPLWNWIVLLSFKTFGVSPIAARIPTLVFLYIFTCHIFFVFRRHLDARHGLAIAAMFLTCGRVLFWDSMFALIDICFSWIIFWMWVWIYENHQRRQFLRMYLGAYALCAIAFMLKALPALVFIGLTLLAWQAIQKTFRHLFYWQHFAGLALLALLVGTYFFLYQQQVSLATLLSVYLTESTQRTVVTYGIWEVVKQLINFPVEMTYHYLPWSLGIVLCWRQGARQHLKQHPWIYFCLITFLANIWLYWTSPEVYARYLIMFAPLYFGLISWCYHHESFHTLRQWFDYVILALTVIALFGCFAAPFQDEASALPGIWLVTVGLFAVLVGSVFALRRLDRHRMLIFCFILLFLRIGFDFVLIPLRSTVTSLAEVKRESLAVGERYAGQPMFIYGDYEVNHENGFYLTSQRNQVLTRSHFIRPGALMLIQGLDYPWILAEYEVVDSIRIKEPEKYFHVVKIPNDSD